MDMSNDSIIGSNSPNPQKRLEERIGILAWLGAKPEFLLLSSYIQFKHSPLMLLASIKLSFDHDDQSLIKFLRYDM